MINLINKKLIENNDEINILNTNYKIKYITEIGNGNINYIYRLFTTCNKSFILKYAKCESRISNDILLSVERNYYEATIMQIYKKYNEKYIPSIYDIKQDKNYFLMEDLNSYCDLKSLLKKRIICEGLIENIENYFKNILNSIDNISYEFNNKIFGIDNIDLVNLTLKLVFEDPYIDNEQNVFSIENYQYIKYNLYDNLEIKKKVLKAKKLFINEKTTVIHGDLHTGSILVSPNKNDMKVIDFEFAMLGPLSFDLGNLLAHFTIIYIIESFIEENEKFKTWISEAINRIIMLSTQHSYLDNNTLVEGTALFCGCELLRRIVGIAKFTELQNLPHGKVVKIEKISIELGKSLLLDCTLFNNNKYINKINNIINNLGY